MGSYWIPSDKLKGEGRILYIFTAKSMIYTAIGAVVGSIFYLIFTIINLKMVGIIILILFALIGFGIGTIKIPTFGNSKMTKNLGGESLDQIIYKYILFKKNRKVYSYSIPRKEPKYGAGTSSIDNILNGFKQKGDEK